MSWLPYAEADWIVVSCDPEFYQERPVSMENVEFCTFSPCVQRHACRAILVSAEPVVKYIATELVWIHVHT